MPSYPSHGMPPGMAAQYGYLHHAAQYPYMHNANVFMYPNYPHPAYAGGAGYPPQVRTLSLVGSVCPVPADVSHLLLSIHFNHL